ncbi:MAG: hypothetical protein NTW87_21950 [Planctomycetota bacterium]|nr:hypothetical protein [Planctomycetota bacterium]
MPEILYWEAIRDALAEEMRANPKVLVLTCAGGLEHADPATQALAQEFGAERVRTAPVSAPAIAGAAAGAAACGYRVVAAIRAAESLPLVLDQLAGQAGTEAVPVVLRVQSGAALEARAVHTPGMLVAAPATPEDAKGLLRTALRAEEDPVLFLEDAQLYSTKGEVSAGDYAVPFGVATVRRAGTQVTVVTYGRMVGEALVACERAAGDHGIDAELLDLRTLKPFDLAAAWTRCASWRVTGER